jgi:hypothetical protein
VLDTEQCLRWEGQKNRWRHPDQGAIRTAEYEVAPVAEAPARAFVEAHHYSGSWPSPRLRYGLYHGDHLVGVAVFSVPMQSRVLTIPFPSLVPMWESLELGRFVLLDQVPANGESWFLARCFELIRREGVKGVVSFSDPVPRTTADGGVVFPGHIGYIYQGSNAIRAGRSTTRTLTLLPDGTVLSERSIQKMRGGEQGRDGVERRLRSYGASPRRPSETDAEYLKRALEEIGVRKLKHRGNIRYLFPLGSAREKRLIEIGIPRGPYPKTLEAA